MKMRMLIVIVLFCLWYVCRGIEVVEINRYKKGVLLSKRATSEKIINNT
jgi:hypothetical protein